jgi:hypothetical protein
MKMKTLADDVVNERVQYDTMTLLEKERSLKNGIQDVKAELLVLRQELKTTIKNIGVTDYSLTHIKDLATMIENKMTLHRVCSNTLAIAYNDVLRNRAVKLVDYADCMPKNKR